MGLRQEASPRTARGLRVDLSQFPLYNFYELCRICKNSWVQPAVFNRCVEVDVDQALPRVCDLVLNKNVQRYDVMKRFALGDGRCALRDRPETETDPDA